MSLVLVFCFFIVISSVSAADFHVKDKTTHKDITNWMKNAKSGNNLIFDGSSYNLADTIIINKAINVKSSKNTKVNFSKNKTMFYITTNDKVIFSGLTLNHNGIAIEDSFAAISASNNSLKKVNVNKVTINAKNDHVHGITISNWVGNVVNSKININGARGGGIDSTHWNGNIKNSVITTKGDGSVSVYSYEWRGNISVSKVYNYGKSQSAMSIGILLPYAKGTISKSRVESPNGHALRIDTNIKVSGSTLKSQKGNPKIYRFLPDLTLEYKKRSGSTYYFNVSNGYYSYPQKAFGSAIACYLGVKLDNKVIKVKVNALTPHKSTTVKITIPSKYIDKSYTKNFKIDYYNKVKEQSKKNNVVKRN